MCFARFFKEELLKPEMTCLETSTGLDSSEPRRVGISVQTAPRAVREGSGRLRGEQAHSYLMLLFRAVSPPGPLTRFACV